MNSILKESYKNDVMNAMDKLSNDNVTAFRIMLATANSLSKQEQERGVAHE